jgi:hypothetical protein
MRLRMLVLAGRFAVAGFNFFHRSICDATTLILMGIGTWIGVRIYHQVGVCRTMMTRGKDAEVNPCRRCI